METLRRLAIWRSFLQFELDLLENLQDFESGIAHAQSAFHSFTYAPESAIPIREICEVLPNCASPYDFEQTNIGIP